MGCYLLKVTILFPLGNVPFELFVDYNYNFPIIRRSKDLIVDLLLGD